jgi:hypothetical protein
MLRKPLFWLAFTLASITSIYFAARYFASAFPIVTLDLRMNREDALSKAREITSNLRLPPEAYREAASFSGDQFLQNFVELEGGGTRVLRSIMAEGLCYPYTWTVRHFKPGETHETSISFTPQGVPYGFAVKVPESEQGPALDAGQAREIAQRSAARDWQVDLGHYQPVEESREVRSTGRVDQTFVYERTDARVGEGRYRLRLVVSGDRLTELSRFVKVPEAFSRRYEQMRSTNDVISTADAFALIVLYFIGGCGFGLFFLLRKRWVIWRTPLFWGLFLALLQLLAGVNELPLSWMRYDTAVSAQSFITQRIVQLVLLFFFYAFIFTLSLMAAESLSRRAFPQHIRQWELWSAGAANSRAVLGRTVGAYLLVGLFFGYEVLLYSWANRQLGWWSPSDALVQPDILSTYLPWLSSIAASAQAGFWEESLFRAVPIAGAALLGARLGGRKWWIAGALVLQALIFGGGHAGYMNQPAYARPVELIIPSLAFGAVYLCFGLLPGIVLHFSFDVVWLALPLFVSSAHGVWLDRIMVLVAGLVPLWIVLGARLRAKRWSEVSEPHLNRTWQPLEVERPVEMSAPVAPVLSGAALLRYFPIAGALGLALWLFAGSFRADAPPLTISRAAAQAGAARALEDRGIALPQTWKVLTALEAQPGPQDRFVWQKAGKDAYKSSLGQYLAPPHWKVRFVRFEGDVAARAEEYQVFLAGAERVFRFRHILPEAAAGSSLAESDARQLAYGVLRQQFQVDPSLLKEVSAVPSKLKARTDWVFTFSDPRGPNLAPGEKRIAVQIAGDQVVDAYRYVHTPEEWDRQDRGRQVPLTIINLCCLALTALLVLAGTVVAVVAWSRKQFVTATFLLVLVPLLALRIMDFLNSLPSILAQFSTAQPYEIQLFAVVAMSLLGALIVAGAMGLIAGFAHRLCMDTPSVPMRPAVIIGASLGCIAAGLAALVSAISPSLAPDWPDYAPQGTYLPLLQAAVAPPGSYLVRATIVLLILAALDRFTGRWTRRKPLFAVLLLLSGFGIAGATAVETVSGWLIAGFVSGVLLLLAYWAVFRFSPPAVIIAAGAFQILGTLKEGFIAAYPRAVPGALIGAVLIAGTALYLRTRFSR